MTLTRSPLLSFALCLLMLVAGALAVQMLVGLHDACADDPVAVAIDAGPPAAVAGPVVVLDAGVVVAPAAPVPPAPSDPTVHPGDTIDGFRVWLKTGGWAMGILFAAASLLIALGSRVKQLQKGRAAIAIATVTAALVAYLGARANGVNGATALSGALSVIVGGVLYGAKPNLATIDLSKATPAQIEAALLAASQPPAAPPA